MTAAAHRATSDTLGRRQAQPVRAQAALACAARGFRVFPLHPDAKTPAIEHWNAAATLDQRRIRWWWRRWPDGNIGIACGPSGLHVLDLDTGHDQPPPAPWAGARDGRDVLARLALDAGQPLPVPTLTVATPSVINGWLGHCNNITDEASAPESISLLQTYQQRRNDDRDTDLARRQERVAIHVQP